MAGRLALLLGVAQLACNAIFGLDELALAPGGDLGRGDGGGSDPDAGPGLDGASIDGMVEVGGPPPSTTRRVFISKTFRPKLDFDGRVRADTLCTNTTGVRAVAWFSDAYQPAIDVLPYVQWVNIHGEVVFRDTHQIIDGAGPRSQIYPADGQDLATFVWTGTGADGRRIRPPTNEGTCNGWSDPAAYGVVGNPALGSASGGRWTNAEQRKCSEALRLYCFEI